MKLSRLLLLFAVAVFLVAMPINAFAALSTVYLDVTNGSDGYTGANETNSPAGTGPKATFNGALAVVAENGTIVVKAGTYNGGDGLGGNIAITAGTNLKANGSLTIEVRQLNSNKDVLLSGGDFTYDIDGGTLNIVSTNSDEYLTINAGDLILGSATRNVSVNIPNATFAKIASNNGIVINGTSSFTNQAPTKGANLNLTYQGGSSITAGPESNYASYGAGVITVNKTAGTKVTLPNAITAAGGIVLTSGDADFTAAVNIGASDVENNGTGTLAFTSTLDLAVTDGTADANLGSIENTSTGTITVSGATTWTGANLSADRTFAAGGGTYVVDNQSTGTVTLGAINLVTADTGNNDNFIFTAVNGSTGSLSLGSVTANESATNDDVGTLHVTAAAAAGTVNLAGGEIRGTITNGAAHTVNINGTATVSGALTNAGTVNVNAATTVVGVLTNSATIALTTNELTLTGSVAHLTNGGTVTASTGGIVVDDAAGANSFNGGTLSNVSIVDGATTTFQTNAINVTNLTVTDGVLTGSIATTASGTMTVNGGTVNVGTVTFTTNHFEQSSGIFTLTDNVASILDINGNFTRTAGTFTANGTSNCLVSFTGTTAQSINGGPLWEVADLTFTNTNATITVGQSIRATGDITISANTNVDMSTLNVILSNDAATITNNGTYTATGGGGVVFGGANTVAGVAAGTIFRGQQLSGTGTYSYLTVDTGNKDVAATNVTDPAGPALRQITAAAHGLLAGDVVYSDGTNALVPAGVYTVATVVDAATIELTGLVGTGGAADNTGTTLVASNFVTMGAAQHVKFSNVLTLKTGDVYVNNGGGSFGPTGTEASIVRSVERSQSSGSLRGVTVNAGGFNTNNAVDYDLTYNGAIGSTDVTITANTNEFDADNVKNLTIAHNSDVATAELILAHGAGLTVKGNVVVNAAPTGKFTEFQIPAQTLTINGTLTVNAGSEISETGGSTIALPTDNLTHTVAGTVTATDLTVTGNNVTLVGSTTAANAATVTNLNFEPSDNNYNFTSSNLQVIAGNLVLQGTSTKTGASATVTMDATHSTLTGNLAVGNGTLGPVATVTIAGATTNVHTGNLVLTDGTLNYTRTAANNTIGGFVTLTKGSLALGSDVLVDGTAASVLTQVDANVNLGGHKLTIKSGADGAVADDYDRTGAGTLTNGTLVLNSTTQAVVVDPGASFVMPNVECVGAGNNASFKTAAEIAGTLLIDNAGTVTQTAGVLTYSGSSIHIESDAGAFTGAMTITGSPTITMEKDYAIPTLVVNSDGGTVTVADGGTPAAARTLTAGTAFTLTKGTVELGKNHLSIATAFTHTAGAINATTGWVKLNVAAPTMLEGSAFENLWIHGSNTSFGTKAVTVTSNLQLDKSIATSADGKLTLGDGCLVHRTDNAATLSKVPAFGTNTDLKYSTYTGAADIAIAKEAPATIRNLTVLSDAGAQKITLASAKTITGTLSLADMLDVTSANPDGAITMADGSTLELKVDGTSALDKTVTKSGAMELVYNGAANTTDMEYGAATAGVYPNYNGNVTFKTTVALANSITYLGNLTFDNGADLTTTGKTVNVQGDVTQSHATSGFFAGTGSVWFTGAENSTLTLTQNEILPGFTNFGINKTDVDNKVTLSGGNLDFATAPLNLSLTKGVLETGSKKVILDQDNNGSGQPTQGFVRNFGVIYGNVEKFINRANTVDISSVEYPTGTAAGEYRPAKLYFKNQPPISISLLISHQTNSPGGENGIPFNTGTVQVTSYPDFYWKVETDLNSIAPSYQFDMELQAEDYAFYETDDIESVRMIRRAQGAIDNQWRLQGNDDKYDNQTVSSDWPLVKVIDATGGLTTEGSIFTFSQSSKAPRWSIAPVPAAIDENATAVVYEYRAVDEDINEWPTIEAVGDLPSFVTLETFASGAADAASVSATDSCTLTIEPTYADSGSYEFTLRATDGTDFVDSTFTIVVNDVNQPASFVTTLQDTMISEDSTFTFTYEVEDLDGNDTYFAVVDSIADDIAISADGVLTFTAGAGAVAGLDTTLIVSITDSVNTPPEFTYDTVTVTFVKQVAPEFGDVLANTWVRTGDTLDFTYTATDDNTPAGDAVTFSLLSVIEDADTVGVTEAGVLTFAPSRAMTGDSVEIKVLVTDKLGMTDTTTAKVAVKSNIMGDADLDGSVTPADASLVLKASVGNETLTGDSLELADVTGNDAISPYDAAWIYIEAKDVNDDTTLFDEYGTLAKTVLAAGTADWSLTNNPTDESFVNVPLTITNASNIYSFVFTAEVDPSVVKVETVSMSLPKGWMSAQNIEDGVLKVAAFGTKAIDASTIGNIKLQVLDKLASAEINGSIVLNENNSRDMKSLSVRQIPNDFKLSQNYPNPFNPTTTIAYQIPEASKVVVNIYDMLGNKVNTLVNQNRAAGYYTVQWNGLNMNGARMASGTYFYHIQAGTHNSTKKMLLIK